MKSSVRLSLMILTVVLGTTGFAHAQTGIGGVRTMADISLWLDASQNSYNNNDTVYTWSDASTNGIDFTTAQAEAAIFKTNQVNGLPSLDFNNSSYLESEVSILDNQDQLTLFMVASPDASQNSFIVASNHDPGSSQKIKWGFGMLTNRWRGFIRQDNSNFINRVTPFSSGYSVLASMIDGTNTEFSFYVNGGLVGGSSSFTFGPLTSQRLVIGRNPNSNGNYFNGKVAEILLYTDILDTTEKVLIENYLDAKYQLGITNDKYAFDADYGEDLAGIGRTSASDRVTKASGTGRLYIDNASSLNDGDYFVWGHDGGALTSNSVDVPAAYVASGGLRLNRIWRVDESGSDVGTVDIGFIMTGIGFGGDPNQYNLLIDTDDGTFANATVSGGAPTISGDTVFFNGVNLADTVFITIGNNNIVQTCTTFTSGTWNAAIWFDCGGGTPDSTKNAYIDNGDAVTITGDESALNVFVANGTLTFGNNSSLIIKRDLTVDNNCAVTHSGSSEMILRGSDDPQNITNRDDDPIQVFDLTLANSNGFVLDTGAFELFNELGLHDGSFTVSPPATFRFRSFSGRTAHLGRIVNSVALNGAYRVDRYIDTRTANWGTVASPVSGANFSDLDDDIYLSGVGGIHGSAAGFQSVYRYDEIGDSYVAINDTADAFSNERGYEVWLAHDMTQWSDSSFDVNGTIDIADESITLNSAGSGWNLIGNPYPTFLSWTSLSTGVTGITGDQFWILDAATSNYVARTDGAFIPPSQGFWVHTSSLGSLDVSAKDDRFNTSVSTFHKFLEAGPEEFEIHLKSKENSYAHSAFLRMDEASFVGRDVNDLILLRSPDPKTCNVTFPTIDSKLMVNYIPSDDFVEIPVEVTSGLAGEFQLTFEGEENLPHYQCINLIDEERGVQIPINSEATYTVNISDPNKPVNLKLLLSSSDYTDCIAKDGNALNEDWVSAFVNGRTLNLDFTTQNVNQATVQIKDISGKLIHTASTQTGFTRRQLQLDALSSGIYMLDIQSSGRHYTQKIQIL